MNELKSCNAEEDGLSDEEVLERLDSVDEEYFPAKVVDRLLAQENPVTVYQEYRGMSLAELAKAAEIGESELAVMESGSRAGPACHLPAVGRRLGSTTTILSKLMPCSEKGWCLA